MQIKDQRAGAANRKWHDRPILFLLAGLISGILAGRVLPGWIGFAWMIAGCSAACAFLLLLRKKPATVAPIILFASLGYIAISPFLLPAFPPASVLPHIDRHQIEISGTVAETPVSDTFRTKCIISHLRIRKNRQTHHVVVPGRIRAFIYGTAPELFPGDRLVFSGKIHSLKNFNNPGGFNYKQFMAYRQVWGTVYINGGKFEIQPNPAIGISRAVFSMRERIDKAISRIAEGDCRAILSALIIGKTGYITNDLREIFSRAGASHLLAISGLHVGIIATCALFLSKWGLGWFPFLLRRGRARKYAALLAFVPVIGYGLISGMSPSTQRAVLMICVLLSAFLFDRDYDPTNTLAAAATAILIVSPQSLFSISFQLSFAAVAAILYGFYILPGLATGAGDSPISRFRKSVMVFMAVSVFAIAGTAPLIMHYFNQFSIIGVLSNLVLIPLIGFVVVPLGLFSTILLPVHEPLAFWGYALADRLIWVGLRIIEPLSEIPFGAFRTVTPSILEIACVYVLLYSLPLLWRLRRRKVEAEGKLQRLGRGSVPGIRAVSVLVLIASAVLFLDAGYWIYRRHLNPNVSVTILDVGQGNAALLELPRGKTMLIDGGGFSNNDIFDVGALVLGPYLSDRKIRTIDTILLTHPDADHLNGLIFILKHFRVGKVISTHLPSDSVEYKQFEKAIKDKGISYPCWKDVERHMEINGVLFDILHPEPTVSAKGATNSNDNSIVVKLTFKGSSILFPGDIQSNSENMLVAHKRDHLAANLLISPHHGSRTSSTPAFLNSVKPECIVVSARKGRFDLPSAAVIDRYERLGARIFRTDIHGAIRIDFDKEGFRIQPVLSADKKSPDRATL